MRDDRSTKGAAIGRQCLGAAACKPVSKRCRCGLRWIRPLDAQSRPRNYAINGGQLQSRPRLFHDTALDMAAAESRQLGATGIKFLNSHRLVIVEESSQSAHPVPPRIGTVVAGSCHRLQAAFALLQFRSIAVCGGQHTEVHFSKRIGSTWKEAARMLAGGVPRRRAVPAKSEAPE